MNGQYSWDDWCDAIDTVMADTGIQSRADAAEIARRRYPHLATVQPPGVGSGQAALLRAAAGGGSAEAQLNVTAKRIAAERRITFAQAYVEALNANPALYVAYLREHEAKLAAGRRG